MQFAEWADVPDTAWHMTYIETYVYFDAEPLRVHPDDWHKQIDRVSVVREWDYAEWADVSVTALHVTHTESMTFGWWVA